MGRWHWLPEFSYVDAFHLIGRGPSLDGPAISGVCPTIPPPGLKLLSKGDRRLSFLLSPFSCQFLSVQFLSCSALVVIPCFAIFLPSIIHFLLYFHWSTALIE